MIFLHPNSALICRSDVRLTILNGSKMRMMFLMSKYFPLFIDSCTHSYPSICCPFIHVIQEQKYRESTRCTSLQLSGCYWLFLLHIDQNRTRIIRLQFPIEQLLQIFPVSSNWNQASVNINEFEYFPSDLWHLLVIPISSFHQISINSL